MSGTSRGSAIGAGIAVIVVWFLALAGLATWATAQIADSAASCEGDWCGLGAFVVAAVFGIWAGLALLSGIGIAITTLVALTRRIRSGLGAGHLATAVGLVGGAELAALVLAGGLAVLVIRTAG